METDLIFEAIKQPKSMSRSIHVIM